MSATAYGWSRQGLRTTNHGRTLSRHARTNRSSQNTQDTLRELGTQSQHMGEVGETIKAVVRVEKIVTSGHGMRTYLVRENDSGNLLEWSSARRYGIFIGEKLRISGVIAGHTTSNGLRVTRLRHCFNPLRIS